MHIFDLELNIIHRYIFIITHLGWETAYINYNKNKLNHF